ncbi:site-specific DNA-methyltransferase [Aquabacterium sp. UBA2148]|uniref:site-specific DNA-methyltransferase n=1 Tax=Aquabacterium sp. UBA2148 TaxID=1946042 RepID=UPI00257D1FDD|nr:site-specific DNA-methyltransferase [Aquabacterium sp. UBA2148]
MPTLDWLDRQAAFQVATRTPTHVLRPHATGHVFGDAVAARNNLLIQGDNLQALKALLPFCRGRVKCIFIDPPYNTKSAFEHYDDNLEHSQWLSMMLPRLQVLRELLSEDGSIWVTLDDAEAHYFKVMADEVFGRQCFIADITWKRRDGAPNDRRIGPVHDHLLVYSKGQGRTAKTSAEEMFNLMQRTEKADAQYQIFEEPFGFDERGPFRKVDSTGNAKGGRHVESLTYPVTNPFTGEQVFPRKGRCWVYSRDVMEAMVKDRRYFWGKDGKAGTPMRKLFKSEAKPGMTAPSIWDDVGLNQHAAREIELLFGEKAAFETPKPEALMQRIIHIASNPGDIVLDSFLGSGTTAAVAHKMGRRWIGVEMGDHAITHCVPRLQKVIEGEQGGISAAVNWQGGGGFQLLQLGAPLFDEQGDIHPDVRFADLAAFVWMRETGTALPAQAASGPMPMLGVHEGAAYYLLFNGILGDRRPASGNVLTSAVLDALRSLCGHAGPKVIYGEACRLGDARLKAEGIVFKQLPHAVPR